MGAEIHSIVEKVKSALTNPAEADDFILALGESVSPHIVIDNPHISLYCVDDEKKQAIFVETPPEVDLSKAVFLYITQYEQAQRVITMPYETLHQLADELDMDDSSLILIYNIGRCGSSVIIQALGQVEGVISLSEPDIYTQITTLRTVDRSRDEDFARLLESCTCVMRKRAPIFAVKFRNSCIHICDLMYQAFPKAKNVFLYRNTETWAQSVISTITPVIDPAPPTPRMLAWIASMTPLAAWFMANHHREPTFNESGTLTWVSAIDAYINFYEQGIPLLALRYEDIRAHSKAVLAALLDYCGLPLASLDAAYTAFSKDSQEGTILSQMNRQQHKVDPISAEAYAEMRAVLREHPVIQTPDYIAPGTKLFGDASN